MKDFHDFSPVILFIMMFNKLLNKLTLDRKSRSLRIEKLWARNKKINFLHLFCCIPSKTRELAGEQDWDDYEFQVFIEK